MYEYILDTKIPTLLTAIALGMLTGALVGSPRIGLRTMLFNYGPAFACAFFLVGVFHDSHISVFDLAAGFLLEFLALLVFTKLFFDALRTIRRLDETTVEPWLRWSLLLQLAMAFPLVIAEGYGIFSQGSRIAYLDDSGSAKYLTYAGVLISVVQSGLIAKRLSGSRSLGPTGYAVVVSTFAFSTLSGSKGSFFLWLFASLALVDYRRVRVRWFATAVALIALGAALLATARFTSELLGISVIDFIELASSRFFLSNDARALSFDLGGGSGQLSELAASSFRGLSSRLGNAPIDPPLGLLLYEQYFGISTGNGANSSLIAIITYYSTPGYAMFASLIACTGLIALYACIISLRKAVRGAIRKLAVTLTGLTLIQQFSQDFLAFQLLVPLACVAGFLFLISNRKYAVIRSRRPLLYSRLPDPEYSRPGS
jgi:hypothetical protein